MSPASHMVGRLRKLYGIVWNQMRFLNERSIHPPVGRPGTPPHCMVEQLEPRLYLTSAPELPGMHLASAALAGLNGQVIYLDFDGAKNVMYHGPATVGPFDVPAFNAPAGMAEQEQAIEADVLKEVQGTFADVGVQFTLVRPEEGTQYSTIYVGGDDSAFRSYGRFDGLAEDVDAGNRNHADNALVFSDGLDDTSQLAAVVEHETGHVLGYAHDSASDGGLSAVASSWGTAIGSFNGVTNYSGDDATMPSPQPRNTTTGIDTGLKWECVEYVNRYYYSVYSNNLGTGRDGWQFYQDNTPAGLTRYANGGTTAPQVGDILCFGGGPEGYGHVAIVRAVGTGTITVIQQHVKNGITGPNGTDDSYTFAYNPSTNVVDVLTAGSSHLGTTYYCQGWLRHATAAENTFQIASTGFAFDAGQPVTIVGRLLDPTGRPVVGATVSADDGLLQTSHSIGTTTPQGYFSLNYTAAETQTAGSGIYLVRLTAPGGAVLGIALNMTSPSSAAYPISNLNINYGVAGSTSVTTSENAFSWLTSAAKAVGHWLSSPYDIDQSGSATWSDFKAVASELLPNSEKFLFDMAKDHFTEDGTNITAWSAVSGIADVAACALDPRIEIPAAFIEASANSPLKKSVFRG